MRRLPKKYMNRYFRIPALFLAAVFGLVHALTLVTMPLKAEKSAEQKAKSQNKPLDIIRDPSKLPSEVDRIRRAILSAAASGKIEAMRIPVEMNEIPPIIGKKKPDDLIEYWKSNSSDGEGREFLAILVKIFRTGSARLDAATDKEFYVWPYFAKTPIDQLTPAQEVELLTIVSPERFKAMRASGKYDFYRIGIGSDGTWHYFVDHEM